MDKKGHYVRKWAIDLADTYNSSRDVPDPPGYDRSALEVGFHEDSNGKKCHSEEDESSSGRQKKEVDVTWKVQKAWEVAQAPFKNLLMMGFMMWMAGSTVHLFSIGITFSALWQPISALQGVGKVFEPFQDSRIDLLLPKVVYTALNLAALLLGIWKLNTLGLLPTHASDWVSSLPPALEIEYSGGGIPFA